MSLRIIFVAITLTFVWIILTESFSTANVIAGAVLSAITLRFVGSSLPSSKWNKDELERVKFHQLITYPFWLIVKVYKDAFGLVKIMFSGAKCDIVEVPVSLKNEILRSILSGSITLTPGTIYLSQNETHISVLSIDEEKADGYPGAFSGKDAIEKQLKKAEQNS